MARHPVSAGLEAAKRLQNLWRGINPDGGNTVLSDQFTSLAKARRAVRQADLVARRQAVDNPIIASLRISPSRRSDQSLAYAAMFAKYL